VSHGNPRREREQRVAQNTPDPDLVKDGKELRSRREILMMRATDPQAVLTPITEAAIFLTVTVEAGAEDAVRNVLADVSGLRRSVGFRIPEGELTCVVGIGATAWDRLFGMPRPAELHPFREVSGPRHSAPATAGDLLFHIRAHRLDLCFELAQRLTSRLTGYGRVVDEVHGFRSFDDRDLLGFVDGTENPEGTAARTAVLIGDEDADFAGGSYVVVQKYLHDLVAWDALPVEEQERAIGRTKLSDLEFPDERKPTNSHLVLNTIVDENGDQQQIIRSNMPFGSVGAGEFGTYFIGYARSPDVIEEMLTNMFVGKPPGNSDRILDFSTAVTGNLFFVPTVGFLDDPPTPEPSPAAGAEDVSTDGSLAIGSLREGLQ
jgi:putative iron-dependent peroxidase